MIPNDTALLIIDIMNPFDFKHGETLAEHTAKIIDPINSLREYGKAHGLPTIYINDHYELWKADYKQIYKKCHNEVSDGIHDPTPTERRRLLPYQTEAFRLLWHGFKHSPSSPFCKKPDYFRYCRKYMRPFHCQ